MQSFRIQIFQRPSDGIGHVGLGEDNDVDEVTWWSLETGGDGQRSIKGYVP